MLDIDTLMNVSMLDQFDVPDLLAGTMYESSLSHCEDLIPSADAQSMNGQTTLPNPDPDLEAAYTPCEISMEDFVEYNDHLSTFAPSGFNYATDNTLLSCVFMGIQPIDDSIFN